MRSAYSARSGSSRYDICQRNLCPNRDIVRLLRGTAMLLENLKVNRVAVHEVFRRNDDKSIQPPAYANNLELLSER